MRILRGIVGSVMLLCLVAGCGGTSRADVERDFDRRSTVLFDGAEGVTAYFSVHIDDRFSWNTASEEKHGIFVELAIERCKSMLEQADEFKFGKPGLIEIIGLLESGHRAFIWRGGDVVEIFTNGGVPKGVFMISDLASGRIQYD